MIKTPQCLASALSFLSQLLPLSFLHGATLPISLFLELVPGFHMGLWRVRQELKSGHTILLSECHHKRNGVPYGSRRFSTCWFYMLFQNTVVLSKAKCKTIRSFCRGVQGYALYVDNICLREGPKKRGEPTPIVMYFWSPWKLQSSRRARSALFRSPFLERGNSCNQDPHGSIQKPVHSGLCWHVARPNQKDTRRRSRV